MGVNFHKGRQSAPHLGHVLVALVAGVAEARTQSGACGGYRSGAGMEWGMAKKKPDLAWVCFLRNRGGSGHRGRD